MISPQGYNLGEEPKSKNPFWDGSGEDSDVNRIYATATVDDQVGTPSVQTTKSIDGHDITFGFNFHNLKGAKGDTGATGATGATGPAGERGPAGEQGPAGERGPAGPTGATGAQGPAGERGPAGANGQDGQDGVSPTVTVSDITGGHRVTITDATGSESFDVLDGEDGQDGAPGAPGQNGQNGQDGVTPDITMSATADATSSASPTVTVTKGGTTANPTFSLAFSGLKGETGATGATGSQGPQGPAGSIGPQGPAGQGVPAGGTAGQVLQKVNGTDYNTKWVTPSSGGANLKIARFESSFDSGTAVATGFYRCPITVRNAASLVSIFENSWTNKKFFDAQITINPNYGPFAYKPAFISKSGSSITLEVYSSSDLNNKTAHVVFIYEE